MSAIITVIIMGLSPCQEVTTLRLYPHHRAHHLPGMVLAFSVGHPRSQSMILIYQGGTMTHRLTSMLRVLQEVVELGLVPRAAQACTV